MSCNPSKLKDEGISVLASLEKEQIVSFTLMVDGTVEIQEECDRYFGAYLDKGQLGRLIAELQALHGQMK